MKPLQVNMTNEQRRALARVARSRGKTLSDTVRELVTEADQATAADHAHEDGQADPLSIASTPRQRA